MELLPGKKVIGMIDWYHSPYTGTLINLNLDVDPLHPILINIKENRTITVLNKQDWENQFLEIKDDVAFISKDLICEYSERKHKNLLKLIAILDSDIGKKYLNYEKSIFDFFDKNNSIYKTKLLLTIRKIKDGVIGFLDNFIIGTVELLFGSIFLFYKKRSESKELNYKKNKLLSENISVGSYIEISSNENEEIRKKHKNEIEALKKDIENNEKDRSDISRSFLAITISIISLIVSSFAILNQIEVRKNQESELNYQKNIVLTADFSEAIENTPVKSIDSKFVVYDASLSYYWNNEIIEWYMPNNTFDFSSIRFQIEQLFGNRFPMVGTTLIEGIESGFPVIIKTSYYYNGRALFNMSLYYLKFRIKLDGPQNTLAVAHISPLSLIYQKNISDNNDLKIELSERYSEFEGKITEKFGLKK